ncbi:MAG: hypothetical protein GXY79_04640 [Chloroflexi bacterium]|nr:hypothetical protein [Chloroflexota bacterium]
MSKLTIPRPFAEVTRLGQPLAVYKQSRSVQVILILGTVFFLALTAWTTYDHITRPLESTANECVIGLFAFFALFCAGCLYVLGHEAAVVYEQGLAHTTLAKLRALRWDQVESVTIQVTGSATGGYRTSCRYILRDRHGERIRLDDTLSNVHELSAIVRAKTLPYIMNRLLPVFDSGKPVQFGSYSITKAEGIRRGGKLLRWEEIASFSVNNGIVRARTRRGGLFSGLRTPIGRIPNIDALVQIVARMAEQPAPERSEGC